jgi:hypothetical protein
MKNRCQNTRSSRRTFLASTATAAALVPLAPIILGAADKADSKLQVVGSGEHRYECIHNWGELPSHVKWGDTHGVAVDEAGLIYVKHRNPAAETMDSIVVFDSAGKPVRTFGKDYHGAGHGIDIRKEGGEEFLYLSCIQKGIVVKTTLKGEVVWTKSKPEEPGVYKDATVKYSPTNVAFGPDGGFYIGDGYGSHYIHQYDKDARWVRTWGGQGTEPGKMRTPHGLWLDDRPGRDKSLIVADRANARLQYFTLDGKHLSFVKDVSFPAHFDIRGDVLLVPDLHARVSLFGKNNQLIAHLGYDEAWTKEVLGENMKMRREPTRWQAGRFIHPHDACFDHAGNIFVVEWVPTGRVTLLRRVA